MSPNRRIAGAAYVPIKKETLSKEGSMFVKPFSPIPLGLSAYPYFGREVMVV
jgi:hypothetical protein